MLECLCAAGLITGLLLRVAAYASFVLMASFGAATTISLGIKAPLNFSVFVDAAAALLLAALIESRDSHPALNRSMNAIG